MSDHLKLQAAVKQPTAGLFIAQSKLKALEIRQAGQHLKKENAMGGTYYNDRSFMHISQKGSKSSAH